MKIKYVKQLCVLIGSAAVISVAGADQQILDDLIVDGSICAGQDCVNGESFGFDTIRLKENNLRIKFQDTSTSASFPSNDWQLTANDSSNGGQNKFSIDDIDGGRTPFTIEAGAASNSLYVEDDGDVGFGTNTPVVNLHVKDGDSPTLRLEQDGSSGFTPQTWDMAGNEANFFIRDASNGSTLPFRIFPSAPSDSLTIEGTTGDIGVGTNSPTAALHVDDNGVFGMLVSGDGTKVSDLRSDDGGIVQWRLLTDGDDRRIVGANQDGAAAETQIQLGATSVVIAGTDITNPFVTFTSAGIVTTGAGSCNPGPCDGVFRPEEYAVESIEEHSKFMWENQYLWGVGPTVEGEPFNLSKKTTGILHELEKAHIYIEQLHGNIKSLEARLSKLEE